MRGSFGMSVVCVAIMAAAPAGAATFTVTTTSDSGAGSLREAIQAANANAGVDRVHFDIPGVGPHTITLASTLPTITEIVDINGFTQPGSSPNTATQGSNAVLQIEINGAGVAVHGLHLFDHTGSSIRGLVINRASSNGIYVDRGGRHSIIGNYIGTNAAGMAALPNGENGVLLEGTFNFVGGTTARQNLISGNASNGVLVRVTGAVDVGPCSSADHNTIEGNLIGTNAAGTAALPNAAAGVALVHTCTLSGTPDAGPLLTETVILRNVISGNGSVGVAVGNGELRIQNNRIVANLIGVDAGETTALPNDGPGVEVKAPLTSIGANVISGNNGPGIHLTEATGSEVLHATIGTNFFNTVTISNTGGGIIVSAATTTLSNDTGITVSSPFSVRIGAVGSGNVISGNSGPGVAIIDSESVLVQGNFIGTDELEPHIAIPNASHGILIEGAGDQAHVIGGLGGNLIVHNGGAGVAIIGATGNRVQQNSMHSNAGLGIDLNVDGPTPNDPLDIDSGANDLQNHPVLTFTSALGINFTVGGTLHSTPNTSFEIDFYESPSCDPSGFGEGQLYIGTHPVVTDAAGNAAFLATFASGTDVGTLITATATPTNAPRNTSEFSQCVVAVEELPGTLEFGSAAYTVNEDGASIEITVVRTGGSNGVVFVEVRTSNGTATAGSDFTDSDTVLSFFPGETERTFTIPITDDVAFEGNETILLSLENPTDGAVLGPTSSATVTIVDDDALAQAESIPALDPRMLAALAIALGLLAAVVMRTQ